MSCSDTYLQRFDMFLLNELFNPFRIVFGLLSLWLLWLWSFQRLGLQECALFVDKTI